MKIRKGVEVMMMGYGYGNGNGCMGIIGMMLHLLIIVGVIFLVIKLVKGNGIIRTSEKTAEKILAERFARGEITDEEYKRMKDVIRN